jgi:hypothetical protein
MISSASTFSGGSKMADTTKLAQAAISFDSSIRRLTKSDAPVLEGEVDIDNSVASFWVRIIDSDTVGRTFAFLPIKPLSVTKQSPVERNDIINIVSSGDWMECNTAMVSSDRSSFFDYNERYLMMCPREKVSYLREKSKNIIIFCLSS